MYKKIIGIANLLAALFLTGVMLYVGNHNSYFITDLILLSINIMAAYINLAIEDRNV